MFVKTRLMTPGPTPTAESTRLAMAAAQPHHRSAAFSALAQRALQGARWLWDTEEVVFVSGSGTAGMEAAMRTTLAAEDRVLVVTGGKFAERWLAIAKRIGCDVTELSVAWGAGADPDALTAALGDGPFDALIMVASETSTGVLHPVAELSRRFRAANPSGLVLVDGITAVGCADLSMRRDGFDVLVSGSQKAFGLPPGLAMVGVSERAWQRASERPSNDYYLDLRRERKQTATGQSAYTPAIPLIVGLAEVLTRWEALGREALFAHAAALSSGVVAGAHAMGLALFPSGTPSPALTALEVPQGIDGAKLRTDLRDRYGVEIAGGQDALKGRVIRIGHLGAVDALDVIATLGALELALADQGWSGELGAGTAAALRVMGPALRAAERRDTINP